MELEKTITKKTKVRLENSFGAVNDWEEVLMTYYISINPIKSTGFFEIIGGSYHAEGGLWFIDGELIDYDGIYDLPDEIREQIRKFGYKVS
jgi:hypothetical protein